MCGICGIYHHSHQKIVDSEQIKKMCSLLIHRGPDDEGIFVQNNIGLGHRRLKIIDLSSTAKQPMSNSEQTIWITFNGEIYNYLALQKELIELGYTFYSHSDTEVLLYSYEQWNTDCLKKLRGFFSFAIWDKRTESLFIARDYVGKKPFYYYYDNETFAFSSEIRSLLSINSIPRTVDQTALHYYLHYHYIPAPFSGFQHIKKLPPAHYMILHNNTLEIKPYWKLQYNPKIYDSFYNVQQRLENTLKEAILLRLRSDVPVGAFLSGGIDSSIVVALMKEVSSEPISTFSIGFENTKYNELPYARAIANYFHTNHTEYIVKPDIENLLLHLVSLCGEPYADSSLIPSYYLCQVAKEKVTVALTGDGGDESLAGYNRYGAFLYTSYLPDSFIKFLSYMSKPFNCIISSSDTKSFLHKVQRFISNLNKDYMERYLYWISHIPEQGICSLYTEEFFHQSSSIHCADLLQNLYNNSFCDNALDKIISTDIKSYLVGDLLPKMDIASMANSLEVRSPLLDKEWLSLTACIPTYWKYHLGTGKYILRKILSKKLPSNFISHSKRGFAVPLGDWLRTTLKSFVYDVILAPNAWNSKYLQKEKVSCLIDEFMKGNISAEYQIYDLLILELWSREFQVS